MAADEVLDPSLISWREDVASHDYTAAENYLSLKGISNWKALVNDLRGQKITWRRANDILRATRLAPLSLTDPGVMRDLKKVLAGDKLSPVLVVVDDIADGYHRVSLAYNLDAFSSVPLKFL